MHRPPVVACYAVVFILAIAACSGDNRTRAGRGGTGGDGGAGGGQGGADCVQEICDGLDNDCNGMIDEGFGPETCGIGACQKTVDTCQNGKAVPCMPLTPAPAEACDGTDDDCDGTVDEGCT